MDSHCSSADVPSTAGACLQGLGTCFYCLVPPRWGVRRLAGIAPAMINAERLLLGIDLLFYAAFAFLF